MKCWNRLENEYVFSNDKLHTGWLKGNSSVFRLYTYPEDSALYVVKCIDEYFKRSQTWTTEIKTQIPLSYISPH